MPKDHDDADDASTFDATPMPPALTTHLPTPKRSALNYFVSATRRSFRDTFSREQLVAGLKAFFWVGPLTVLIWVYAEREQVEPLPNFQIPIELTSNVGGQVITVRSPADRRLTADLSGPRAQLERVREDFRNGVARARFDIGTVEPGEHTVSAEAVANDPRFASNGIVVENLRPSVVEIFVDVLEDRQIDVRVPDGVTNLEIATFDPPTVLLRAPRSVFEAAPQTIVAYVDADTLRQIKTPGRHEDVQVRVKVPLNDPNARLATTSVKADLVVKQADERLELAAIPVAVTFISRPNQNAPYLEYEASLTDVTVVGPAEQIAVIRAGGAVPRARFEVTADDLQALAGGAASRRAPVKYDLPEGVKATPEDVQRTIEFRLGERGATE